MDADKLKTLRQLEYRIKKTCNFCTYRNFSHSYNWGTCDKHTYDHQKHTDNKRHLSIHRNGYCSYFELDKDEMNVIHSYQEFVE